MKCQNCQVEINKAFKSAISTNRCPACSKQIINAGNLTAFVPLCELISGAFELGPKRIEVKEGEEDELVFVDQDKNVEALATLIISTFSVRIKGAKEESEQEAKVVEPGSDAEHKQNQMAEGKAMLQKLREEALKEATAASWGLAPGEEMLDPDVGEALASQILPDTGPNIGQAMVDQKRITAYNNMINGQGKIKRS